MSDTVSIKKSTAKKIAAIVLCVVILSVVGCFCYQSVYLVEQSTLTDELWHVETELGNKSHEVALLKSDVNRLQNELVNLQDTLSKHNSTVVELNLHYADLTSQVIQANQTVSDLKNQLAEAQSMIEDLLDANH